MKILIFHSYINFCIPVNLIIMLSLGSIESDCVVIELCYNEAANNRHMSCDATKLVFRDFKQV